VPQVMRATTEFSGVFVAPEGPLDANIVLVGQNPGVQEGKQGRPFVGRSGKYLDSVLAKYQIDRRLLYITSVVKVTTLNNRPPTTQEISHWMPSLLDEIKQVNPGIVLLMGTIAWKTPRTAGIEYIQTYHPAAAMRFPKIKPKFENDIGELAGREKRIYKTEK
jgi:uracil-DNA glycosylase